MFSMPPKKKKWFSSPDEKPEIAKQHLLDIFAELPAHLNSILNGHVLYLYVVECERSRAMTERKLTTLIDESTISIPRDNRLSLHLKAGIKRLVDRTLNKFRRLSCSEQFQKFVSECQKSFSLTPDSDEAAASNDPEFAAASANVPQPEEMLEVHPNLTLPENVDTNQQVEPVIHTQLAKCTMCKSKCKDMIGMHQKMKQIWKTLRIQRECQFTCQKEQKYFH